jgi:hypothetical protein
LILVKDNDNKILKKICYKYNNIPEVCNATSGGGNGCTNTQPDWQNTSTALRCQQGTCGYNGNQEQEQMDMNPCSAGYLTATRWVVAGYNPSVCVPGTGGGVTITFNNFLPSFFSSGYSALYTNLSTNVVYPFSIPPSGTGALGCVPEGNYSITISRSTWSPFILYNIGCAVQTGSSATFNNIYVSSSSCNSVTLDPYAD